MLTHHINARTTNFLPRFHYTITSSNTPSTHPPSNIPSMNPCRCSWWFPRQSFHRDFFRLSRWSWCLSKQRKTNLCMGERWWAFAMLCAFDGHCGCTEQWLWYRITQCECQNRSGCDDSVIDEIFCFVIACYVTMPLTTFVYDYLILVTHDMFIVIIIIILYPLTITHLLINHNTPCTFSF